MPILINMHENIKAMKWWQIILTMLLMNFIIMIPASIILSLLPQSLSTMGGPDFTGYRKIEIVVLTLVIAPLLETALGQALPIFICRKIKPNKYSNLIGIIVSAIIFGANHYYSIAYIIVMFFTGLILAWTYIIGLESNKHPYWLVVCLHMCKNLIAIASLII